MVEREGIDARSEGDNRQVYGIDNTTCARSPVAKGDGVVGAGGGNVGGGKV